MSVKRIPSIIDENSSDTNQSDSLLNETDCLDNAAKSNKREIKQNLNSNGSTANSEVTTDDENILDTIAPQKSSSPMIKKGINSSSNTKVHFPGLF